MPASGPRSRGARAHPTPHQGHQTLARRSASSGLSRPHGHSRHDLSWSAPTRRPLRLATQNLGGITGRGTSRVQRWATFDCYGTLIDWNGGILGVLEQLFGVARAPELLARYHELEPEI